jgi:hypothetical protein
MKLQDTKEVLPNLCIGCQNQNKYRLSECETSSDDLDHILFFCVRNLLVNQTAANKPVNASIPDMGEHAAESVSGVIPTNQGPGLSGIMSETVSTSNFDCDLSHETIPVNNDPGHLGYDFPLNALNSDHSEDDNKQPGSAAAAAAEAKTNCLMMMLVIPIMMVVAIMVGKMMLLKQTMDLALLLLKQINCLMMMMMLVQSTIPMMMVVAIMMGKMTLLKQTMGLALLLLKQINCLMMMMAAGAGAINNSNDDGGGNNDGEDDAADNDEIVSSHAAATERSQLDQGRDVFKLLQGSYNVFLTKNNSEVLPADQNLGRIQLCKKHVLRNNAYFSWIETNRSIVAAAVYVVEKDCAIVHYYAQLLEEEYNIGSVYPDDYIQDLVQHGNTLEWFQENGDDDECRDRKCSHQYGFCPRKVCHPHLLQNEMVVTNQGQRD